jgi:hypothetical protein
MLECMGFTHEAIQLAMGNQGIHSVDELRKLEYARLLTSVEPFATQGGVMQLVLLSPTPTFQPGPKIT